MDNTNSNFKPLKMSMTHQRTKLLALFPRRLIKYRVLCIYIAFTCLPAKGRVPASGGGAKRGVLQSHSQHNDTHAYDLVATQTH